MLCTGAHEAAFWTVETITEALADELSVAKGSSSSCAVKKDEP